MPADEKRTREDEQYRSRDILAKADAVALLVDKRFESLEKAAAVYRERLEGTREH